MKKNHSKVEDNRKGEVGDPCPQPSAGDNSPLEKMPPFAGTPPDTARIQGEQRTAELRARAAVAAAEFKRYNEERVKLVDQKVEIQKQVAEKQVEITNLLTEITETDAKVEDLAKKSVAAFEIMQAAIKEVTAARPGV